MLRGHLGMPRSMGWLWLTFGAIAAGAGSGAASAAGASAAWLAARGAALSAGRVAFVTGRGAFADFEIASRAGAGRALAAGWATGTLRPAFAPLAPAGFSRAIEGSLIGALIVAERWTASARWAVLVTLAAITIVNGPNIQGGPIVAVRTWGTALMAFLSGARTIEAGPIVTTSGALT